MKKAVSLIIVGLFLLSYGTVSALTEAQIQSIIALVRAFGADQSVINNVEDSLYGRTTTSSVFCYRWNNDLKVGDGRYSPLDEDVFALKTALSREGLFNPNSESGQRTMGAQSVIDRFFTEQLASAVIRFQEKYGIQTTGYVGPVTRARLNALYGCTTLNSDPYIERITSSSGPVGTTIDIIGRNFAGFEGDLNVWIENERGEKGILYGAGGLYPSLYKTIYTGKELIRVSIPEKACVSDNSYSGLPCSKYVTLNPGLYKLYTSPWNKKSNSVYFTVTGPVQPSITVAQPNGGETLTLGTPYTFRWNTTGTIGPVDIYLIDVNESRHSALQSLVVATGVSNTGSYTVTLPTNTTYFSYTDRFGSPNYKVRLYARCDSCANTESVQKVIDESDSNVTIANIPPSPQINMTKDSQPSPMLAVRKSVVPFLKFSLTPSGSGTPRLMAVTLEKTGSFSSNVNELEKIIITSDDSKDRTIAEGTLHSANQARLAFFTPINLAKPTQFTVHGIMKNDLSSFVGNTVGLSLVGLETSSGVIGSLPITGPLHTVNNSLNIGIPQASFNVSSGGNNLVINGSSIESIRLKKIVFRTPQVGFLYSPSYSSTQPASICEIVSSVGSVCDFGSSGLIIPKNGSVTLTGLGNSVISNSTDIVFLGDLYGYRPVPIITTN